MGNKNLRMYLGQGLAHSDWWMTDDRINEWMNGQAGKTAFSERRLTDCETKFAFLTYRLAKKLAGSRAANGNFAKCITGSLITLRREAIALTECEVKRLQMCVRACVCVHVCACTCVHVWARLCACVRACVWPYVCIRVCARACVWACMFMRVCVSICVHARVGVCVRVGACMCVCAYVHVHAHPRVHWTLNEYFVNWMDSLYRISWGLGQLLAQGRTARTCTPHTNSRPPALDHARYLQSVCPSPWGRTEDPGSGRDISKASCITKTEHL